MSERDKITQGTNDRSVDETIAQSGPGLPDDSSLGPDISENEIKKQSEAFLKRQSNTGAKKGRT